MGLLCRIILVLAIFGISSARMLGAAAADALAFKAAAEAFQGGFYDRAQAEFAEFAQKYPASSLLPEAWLFQAQALILSSNYTGGLALLSAHAPAAGALADQYAFWQAEAQFRLGDYAKAGNMFAKFGADFTNSPRRLDACIGEATASSRLAAWPRVIEILEQTNGVFRTAAAASPTNAVVLRGYLLLSAAHLAREDWTNALRSVEPLAKQALPPVLGWERQFLVCRSYLGAGRLEEALQGATNLVSLAAAAGQRALQAESAAFRGSILERLNRPEEAIEAYRANLAEGVSADRQRFAVLKITELSLAQGKFTDATAMIERFLAQNAQSPVTDLVLLSLGELRLRQLLSLEAGSGAAPPLTNSVAVTNAIEAAIDAFRSFTNQLRNSPLFPKAQLNLGWCYLKEGRLPEAETAFQNAAAGLPHGMDQATAFFKLADVQVQLRRYAPAVSNYSRVLSGFGDAPEVKTNLFEPALYQKIRAALGAGDVATATNAVAALLASYPSGFHTDRAALLAGQQISRKDPAAARAMLTAFLKASPEGPLVPLVQLALARTYEQENQWTNAIRQYDEWIAVHTNNDALPRAEYYRAWANYRAGFETNAFASFTNFIARFPANEFTPLAQWWVGDFCFRSGDFINAERNYKVLFQNANWAPSGLAYQARMMAGRSALARQGWTEALTHFTNLTSDVSCPADLWIQAMFAYGDTLMTMDSAETNKLANYQEAIRVFSRISEMYPTNREAVLATGQKANCLLQWGQLDLASNAFQHVVLASNADISARSMAMVGLGLTLEKQAQQKAGAEQAEGLKAALNHYLDVLFYEKILREGEQPDLFWVKKAGMEAGRLAEAMHEWGPAIRVYERLRDLIPSLRPRLDNKLDSLRAQQQIASGGS